jgi:hypothetical protein
LQGDKENIMAYEVVESKSFSGAEGFWKPKKPGDEMEGIFLKVAIPKTKDGWLVFQLLKDCKAAVKNEKTGESDDKVLKAGTRINVNYWAGLSAVLDYAGYPVMLTYKGKRKFGTQGHSAVDVEVKVDRKATKANVPPVTPEDKARLEKKTNGGGARGDEVPF